MIRTAIAVVAILASILWLPLWVQLVLFVLAVIFTSYRLWLFVPALVADVLYAPTSSLSLFHFKMTIFVGLLLVVWYVITTKTRLSIFYVPKTK